MFYGGSQIDRSIHGFKSYLVGNEIIDDGMIGGICYAQCYCQQGLRIVDAGNGTNGTRVKYYNIDAFNPGVDKGYSSAVPTKYSIHIAHKWRKCRWMNSGTWWMECDGWYQSCLGIVGINNAAALIECLSLSSSRPLYDDVLADPDHLALAEYLLQPAFSRCENTHFFRIHYCTNYFQVHTSIYSEKSPRASSRELNKRVS